MYPLFGLTAEKARKLKSATIVSRATRYLEVVEEHSRIRPDPLSHSAGLMGSALGLTGVETRVLALAVAFSLDDLLRSVFELVRCAGPMEVYESLGLAIGEEPGVVRRAIRDEGGLAETGLVRMSWTSCSCRDVPLALLEDLDEILLGDVESAKDILDHFFRLSPASKITGEDISHLNEDFDLLRRIIGPAVERKQPGINVLVHGPSGTGKTQLVRLLARELGIPLPEVADEDSDGDSISHSRRFASYALCQRMLAPSGPALVLFDEAEDVFPSDISFFGMRLSNRETGKAWTNRLLESNPVPTIWISNAVHHMDSAYLRRFCHVLELRPTPPKARERLVVTLLEPHGISRELGRRIAADDRLTPGHVEVAARSLELAAPTPGREADEIAARILEGTLSVQGSAKPKPILHDGPAYDLSFLRASEDLALIVSGLAKTGKGSVCLYGPPGTGKTAFVHHVAERLGRPMMLKRASDLMNPFVGMTERNISEMFRDAWAEGAVLLLDEADGMLRDRRHARQRWELTETNEMLTQMESFDGIFFCSTNLVGELDRASLRRFALKIRIDPPGEEARWRLFLAALDSLGAEPPGP
ncbi:MAG: AAA family ATPase, partial [Myxococcota bacterium]